MQLQMQQWLDWCVSIKNYICQEYIYSFRKHMHSYIRKVPLALYKRQVVYFLAPATKGIHNSIWENYSRPLRRLHEHPLRSALLAGICATRAGFVWGHDGWRYRPGVRGAVGSVCVLEAGFPPADPCFLESSYPQSLIIEENVTPGPGLVWKTLVWDGFKKKPWRTWAL